MHSDHLPGFIGVDDLDMGRETIGALYLARSDQLIPNLLILRCLFPFRLLVSSAPEGVVATLDRDAADGCLIGSARVSPLCGRRGTAQRRIVKVLQQRGQVRCCRLNQLWMPIAQGDEQRPPRELEPNLLVHAIAIWLEE